MVGNGKGLGTARACLVPAPQPTLHSQAFCWELHAPGTAVLRQQCCPAAAVSPPHPVLLTLCSKPELVWLLWG